MRHSCSRWPFRSPSASSFATFITLILVPTSYLIVEDIRRVARKLAFGDGDPDAGVPLPLDPEAAASET